MCGVFCLFECCCFLGGVGGGGGETGEREKVRGCEIVYVCVCWAGGGWARGEGRVRVRYVIIKLGCVLL